VSALATLPLMRDRAAAVLETVARNTVLHEYPPEHKLLQEGEPAFWCFYLISGSVSLHSKVRSILWTLDEFGSLRTIQPKRELRSELYSPSESYAQNFTAQARVTLRTLQPKRGFHSTSTAFEGRTFPEEASRCQDRRCITGDGWELSGWVGRATG
jgi:hypothetical protein